jgi:hypothetical protein
LSRTSLASGNSGHSAGEVPLTSSGRRNSTREVSISGVRVVPRLDGVRGPPPGFRCTGDHADADVGQFVEELFAGVDERQHVRLPAWPEISTKERMPWRWKSRTRSIAIARSVDVVSPTAR